MATQQLCSKPLDKGTQLLRDRQKLTLAILACGMVRGNALTGLCEKVSRCCLSDVSLLLCPVRELSFLSWPCSVFVLQTELCGALLLLCYVCTQTMTIIIVADVFAMSQNRGVRVGPGEGGNHLLLGLTMWLLLAHVFWPPPSSSKS